MKGRKGFRKIIDCTIGITTITTKDREDRLGLRARAINLGKIGRDRIAQARSQAPNSPRIDPCPCFLHPTTFSREVKTNPRVCLTQHIQQRERATKKSTPVQPTHFIISRHINLDSITGCKKTNAYQAGSSQATR